MARREQVLPAQQQQSPRAQVLRRSFWAERQLDLFAAARLDNPLNPYARHLQRMRDMRAQERSA